MWRRTGNFFINDVSIQSDEDFVTEIVTLQIQGGRDRTLGFPVVGYSRNGVDNGIFVARMREEEEQHISAGKSIQRTASLELMH